MHALPSRRSWRSLAVVAALHVLALLLLGSARVWPDRTGSTAPAAPPVTWLRLLPPPDTAAAAAGPPAQDRPPAAPRPPSTVAPGAAPPLLWLPPAAMALPGSTATDAAAAAPATQAAAADPPASAASAPLRLTLPRGLATQRPNPAVGDERWRAERKTVETRVRDATGGVGEALIEERSDDGTLTLRRGTTCVRVLPSKAAAIDPFNQSAMPVTRGVQPCR